MISYKSSSDQNQEDIARFFIRLKAETVGMKAKSVKPVLKGNF